MSLQRERCDEIIVSGPTYKVIIQVKARVLPTKRIGCIRSGAHGRIGRPKGGRGNIGRSMSVDVAVIAVAGSRTAANTSVGAASHRTIFSHVGL